MQKRDEEAQENSTWNRTAANERVFIVVERDICAPATIRNWAALAKAHGASEGKCQEALRAAAEIELWQIAHPERVKVPD